MKKIAIIAGGEAGEFEVSEKSAAMVLKCIPAKKYEAHLVVIRKGDWNLVQGNKKYPIDKNDFSATVNRKKITFDCAYIIVHGTPGEDGKLQGYFELLGIPYTSPNVLVSSLTMNKYLSKMLCKEAKMNVAKSVLVKSTDKIIHVDKIAAKLKLPCFVKPNNGGSSVATNKVYEKPKMVDAIEEAFEYDNEVIIEEFIKGREVTCGVYRENGEIVTLPITEIVPHNDFFDYDAKYNGESDEITPARINSKLTKKIQKLTAKIYELFNIEGLVRIDFILKGEKAYFMEVNTVPGFSQASLVPQQIRAAGKKEGDVISTLIEQAIKRKK